MNLSATNSMPRSALIDKASLRHKDVQRVSFSKRLLQMVKISITGLLLRTYLTLSWLWYFVFIFRRFYRKSLSVKPLKTIPEPRYHSSLSKAA